MPMADEERDHLMARVRAAEAAAEQAQAEAEAARRRGTELADQLDGITRYEELDRLRAEFISTVSHDLRTPLAAARAALGLLETSAAGHLAPAERQLLGNARRNIQRLGLLIDDLVTVNQLEAGTLHLAHGTIDLRGVVMAALPVVHPLFQEKEQVLEVDLPARLPVEGDSWRLEQVMVNVLANAHQHTPPGTHVTISGRVAGDEVELTVSDTGPGIPAAELERIFDRFSRGNSSEAGTGLGLAIVRGIVELHGGRAWADSPPGRGATIHIALPRPPEGRALEGDTP